jgi:hypothetical protein
VIDGRFKCEVPAAAAINLVEVEDAMVMTTGDFGVPRSGRHQDLDLVADIVGKVMFRAEHQRYP